jgi:cytoskeletal protein RodZ
MFRLGSSLRQARVHRGIELAQVATETRIRTRYLQALEEERFELLPGSVYAKGFLRAYADCLGLETNTVLRALRLLRDEGLLEFRRGRGITVASSSERRPSSYGRRN